MDQKALLLWENELQTNKLIAKSGRIIFGFSLGILLLNGVGVFDALPSALRVLNLLLIIPLLLPTILVDILKREAPWVKYISLAALISATGISYVLLTFQTLLLLVMPTLVATLYFREKVLKVVMIESVINILIAHYLSYYFVAQPWIEPFYDLKAIMLYGAVPRILQYLCFAGLCLMLCKRMMGLMLSYYEEKKEKEILEIKSIMEAQKIQYEERERMSGILHNSVGHSITAAIMSLDAAEAIYEINPQKAREKMNRASERMRESLMVIRETVRQEVGKQKYNLQEGTEAILQCITHFEQDTAIKMRKHIDDTGLSGREYSLDYQSLQAFLQIVQELFTNSVKHGEATAIIILVKLQKDCVHLLIQDNGEGAKVTRLEEQKGFGLKHIKQYIQSKGGTLTYSQDEGFKVEIRYRMEWKDGCD